MNCPDCGEPMELVTMPSVVFTLFNRWSLLDMNAKDYVCYCGIDNAERDNNDQIYSVGFEKGFEAGRTERNF